MTRRRQHGFTYLSLMILLAIIGLVTASSIKLGSVLQRSRAEQELLEIGAAFSDALQSYAEATPAGQPTMPPSLKDLLRDPRFPTLKRHLRKIFVDPVTGRAEWGMVYAGDQSGVIAVYSLSNAHPVKISNFPQRFAGFAGALRISDWKFSATSKATLDAENSGTQEKKGEDVVKIQHQPEKTGEIPNSVQEVTRENSEDQGSPMESGQSSSVTEKVSLPLQQHLH